MRSSGETVNLVTFGFLVLLQYSAHVYSASYSSFPGFFWGWGGQSQNNTKTVTDPPQMVQIYPSLFPYRQCSGGMNGIMTSFELYPCIWHQGRCHIARGGNITLGMEFISFIPAENVVGSVSGVYNWLLPAQYIGEPQDLCKSEYITCPIQPHQRYEHRQTIPVTKNTVPLMQVDVRVILETQNGKKIACVVAPVTTTDPISETNSGLPPSPRETIAL